MLFWLNGFWEKDTSPSWRHVLTNSHCLLKRLVIVGIDVSPPVSVYTSTGAKCTQFMSHGGDYLVFVSVSFVTFIIGNLILWQKHLDNRSAVFLIKKEKYQKMYLSRRIRRKMPCFDIFMFDFISTLQI